MADRTKQHEVVDFINRKEGSILRKQKSPDRTLCEVFCNDCHKPTCKLCVTTANKKLHDNTDIQSIIDNLKKRIAADVENLENTVRPNYRKDHDDGDSSTQFDKVMIAIQDQEDTICKMVREISSELKNEVAKQVREFEEKHQESKTLASNKKKKIQSSHPEE